MIGEAIAFTTCATYQLTNDNPECVYLDNS
jgi:hypothetical protein